MKEELADAFISLSIVNDAEDFYFFLSTSESIPLRISADS
jgi:hypothetical protein